MRSEFHPSAIGEPHVSTNAGLLFNLWYWIFDFCPDSLVLVHPFNLLVRGDARVNRF